MKDRKIQWISGGVAALLLAAFLLLLLFATRQDLFSSRQMEVFGGDWTYRCGQAEGAGPLPAKLDVPRGAEVEYTKKIPADADEDSAVAFRTRMQYVRVYVGDRLAYEFPEEKLIGVKITNAWNFVRLGPEDAGKEIRIVIRSPYRFCGGAIGQVFYGDFDDMVTTIISKQTKLSRASSLIGLSGIVILLISLLGRRHRLYSWHRNLGILLLCLVFWLAGGAGLPSGIVGLEAWYYFSALSALAFPAFLAAYLYERWPGIWGKGTKGLFYLTLAYAAAALLSSLAGGPDLVILGPVTAVAAGASLLYALAVHIAAVRRKEGDHIRSELACLVIAVAVTVADAAGTYGSAERIGFAGRLAILLYALNQLRIILTTFMQKVRDNKELTRLLKMSRAELMASQIKPHFIYNALNSIRTLIKVDPDKAQQTVYDFSTYLRSNLDNTGAEAQIPFSRELRHIEAYLNIEKIRFEERLQVATDIRAKSFLVPPLSVQPLVENAVKHGICTRVEGGTVTIRSREEADAYVVEVEDDGVGFDPEELEQRQAWGGAEHKYTHIGLANIRFRVEELAGGSLAVASQPGKGTLVTVRFPKTEGTAEKGSEDTCES